MFTDPNSDPKAWEQYFKSIVRLHYKPANFCDMPDSQNGDFGIECYTLSGHVFQCYLPEQSSDVEKLVKSQRRKINTDILKFTTKYREDLELLFGDTKISRWILATPYSKSSKLTQYCTQKSLRVRALGLPYVSNDFQILVKTDSDYITERALLRRTNFQLNLELDNSTVENAVSFINENVDFLDKLNLKLPKIDPSESAQESYRHFLIQKYLDYQNLLDELKQNWVDIYQVVYKCIQQRETNLVGLSMLSSSGTQPGEKMLKQMEALKSDIEKEIPTFKGSDLEKINWGVISDWLIRCPLDF
ncbi:TPA: hypothetical protein ACN7G2_002989 [Klebsiella pneumoniae]|uniref:hypothetical protein n=1 Tax=Enterobacterales TaxID=91347 RepID=UPI000C13C66D|nr:hypothetical protein [Serratia marcescens]EEY5387417.1 hypothetical protein [Escherichia coli]EFJ6858063.1 hypothetical protein [Escherichia coli]EFJ8918374.1 hypothetical protein [Escherichia coli]PHY73007.1 hypothetical protein CS366_25720 [Serratia marcescens]PIC11179.1 hypothetical protein CS367_10050 [Serratia marcescens]